MGPPNPSGRWDGEELRLPVRRAVCRGGKDPQAWQGAAKGRESGLCVPTTSSCSPDAHRNSQTPSLVPYADLETHAAQPQK